MKKKAKPRAMPRRIKTLKLKLTPDTALKIAVPKDVVPTVIADPTGGLHIIPVPANKLAEPGWFKRWFG